ncbi:ThuA domain-containing protein [Hymenobacter sp. BT683]|uniref:ThuA domain-containing protein n=1 Tax=Hymenobacter jeongseonensis TaxID=2791027 RepID=A0ABS0IP91_9BACT|nr:ThuA domain-containing protein [Hymenobacter jeongseonensis]MBF9239869.1 ThuA domain-containing protein [Hymenobacter jeongseonensis]
MAIFLVSCSPTLAPQKSAGRPSVLLFYKTRGFRHASIAAGIAALQQLGRENGIRVDTTRQPARLVPDTLQRYGAVVFLNTTGDVLDDAQQAAFEQYIAQGHGVWACTPPPTRSTTGPGTGGWWVLTSKATPRCSRQPATVLVSDTAHPATAFLPGRWVRTDEWYNFRDLAPDLRVLATLDETSYSGGLNGPHHSIVWCQSYGGGRAFYTAGGHTDESYTEPLFRRHLLGGLRYVLGR